MNLAWELVRCELLQSKDDGSNDTISTIMLSYDLHYTYKHIIYTSLVGSMRCRIQTTWRCSCFTQLWDGQQYDWTHCPWWWCLLHHCLSPSCPVMLYRRHTLLWRYPTQWMWVMMGLFIGLGTVWQKWYYWLRYGWCPI